MIDSPSNAQRRKAFTLMEVMVSAGLTTLIAGAAMLSFVAFQKCYELSMARSGVRSNVVRLFDALEIDLRNATKIVAAVNGPRNTLPLTLTLPQRYSDYESSAGMAGEPGRSATRLAPTFNPKNGKLEFAQSITVTYALAPNGPTQNLTRLVSWKSSPAGVAQSASRVIATVPADTAITIESPTGGLLAEDDLALVARVSAKSNSKIGRSSVPLEIASTVFLRGRAVQ